MLKLLWKIMKEKKSKKSNVLKFFVAIFIGILIFNIYQFVNIANAGVPKILSFQGRLTDASGNLLGSNGTNFYFKFAIFDSQSGGNQLWPSTPIASSATITAKVTQGVFNALLGDTTAGFEAISLDFDSTSYFLEVRVSELGSVFDTLTPRQRVVSSGFAVNADTVHGGRFLNTSGVGQFGGLATVGYSRFGTDTTSHAGTINSSKDLLVSGGLEVNGSASFDGLVSFGGTGSTSAAGEWNFDSNTLVIDSGTDHVGVGTSNPARKFDVLEATSNPQFRLSQSSLVYAEFYIDPSGDIHLSATDGAGGGGGIRGDDMNLYVCSGVGCGVTDPVDKGNVIVETSVLFGNAFRFKQSVNGVTGSKSVDMYDSANNPILEFDENQQ